MNSSLSPVLVFQQIRLLLLHPGKFGEKIVCSTKISLLESCPQYEALSYVWGDQNVTSKDITRDGRVVAVTPNLESALQRLRNPATDRVLWVDALCIDQSNLAEKSEQIRLMQSIYKSCRRCLIWFGELSLQNVELADVQALFIVIRHYAGAAMSPLEMEAIRGHRIYETLDSMTNNSWWSRMWTVQEIALPPGATIIWGTESIDWEQMDAATDKLNGFSPGIRIAEIPQLRALSASIKRFCNIMHTIAVTRPLDRHEGFWNTLMRFHIRETTEPRDRVFGLLGRH